MGVEKEKMMQRMWGDSFFNAKKKVAKKVVIMKVAHQVDPEFFKVALPNWSKVGGIGPEVLVPETFLKLSYLILVQFDLGEPSSGVDQPAAARGLH